MARSGSVSARGCVSLEEAAGPGCVPALPGHRQEAWEGHPEALFRVQQRLDWCETPLVGSHQRGEPFVQRGF